MTSHTNILRASESESTDLYPRSRVEVSTQYWKYAVLITHQWDNHIYTRIDRMVSEHLVKRRIMTLQACSVTAIVSQY